MGYYVTLVDRNLPTILPKSFSELSYGERWFLQIYSRVQEDFVITQNGREMISLNSGLENYKEVERLVYKIMASKYMPERLLEKFDKLTDSNASSVLSEIHSKWRKEIIKRDLYRETEEALKSAKSMRIHWLVKRNREKIREAFDIGYGVYDKEKSCDWSGGAENAFMYGYLLGVQSEKGVSA